MLDYCPAVCVIDHCLMYWKIYHMAMCIYLYRQNRSLLLNTHSWFVLPWHIQNWSLLLITDTTGPFYLETDNTGLFYFSIDTAGPFYFETDKTGLFYFNTDRWSLLL